MGLQEDIEAKLADKPITKIHGQPTNRDITQLKRELTKMAANISTALGGGKHGHVGIIIEKDEYIKFSEGGAEFDIPSHPGHSPATVSSVAAARDKEFAAHKAKIAEYEVCAGVINACKEKIAEAVDEEWLEEISDDILGFQNKTVQEMLKHLEDRGGKIDYIDIQAMKKERDAPWDTNEHIVVYFTKVERVNKRLAKQYKTDEKELLSNALYTIRESGEMEWALKEWEKKATEDKTWKNCKSYFSKEYADRRKHELVKAKQAGFANQANEHDSQEGGECDLAELTNEIVQQLRGRESNELKEIITQQKQMLEANQKLMTQLMQNVLTLKTGTSQFNNQTGGGANSKPKYQEWQTKKEGDSIQHDGKTWWWCSQHREGQGLYVRHKPENHDKWLAMKKGGPAFRETD